MLRCKVLTRFTSPDQLRNIVLIEEQMDAWGIFNIYARRGLLTIVGKESGFIPKSEYSYKGTPNNRLRSLFGSKLSKYSEEALTELKRNDVAFYEAIYGGRYGNKEYGDGYKYRGRGFNQNTFKSLYEKLSQALNLDLVSSPDLMNTPEVAAMAYMYFISNRFKTIPKDMSVRNINGFTDLDSAVYTIFRANAGWLNTPTKEGLERAYTFSKLFIY